MRILLSVVQLLVPLISCLSQVYSSCAKLGIAFRQESLEGCGLWGCRVGHDWATELSWTDCDSLVSFDLECFHKALLCLAWHWCLWILFSPVLFLTRLFLIWGLSGVSQRLDLWLHSRLECYWVMLCSSQDPHLKVQEGHLSHAGKVKVAQSCPTLCNLMNYSPPGSSVHRILQTGILELVAFLFSKGSFRTQR